MTKSLYIAEKPSVAQEFAAQGWILRVGSVRRNLVRRSPGYDELSGKI